MKRACVDPVALIGEVNDVLNAGRGVYRMKPTGATRHETVAERLGIAREARLDRDSLSGVKHAVLRVCGKLDLGMYKRQTLCAGLHLELTARKTGAHLDICRFVET